MAVSSEDYFYMISMIVIDNFKKELIRKRMGSRANSRKHKNFCGVFGESLVRSP